MTVSLCPKCAALLLDGSCARCVCAATAAEIVEKMLAADTRASSQWGAVACRLREGDVLGAARALDRVAAMTEEARRLADIAAIAVVGLITLEDHDKRTRRKT